MTYYHVITQSHRGKIIFRDEADCLFYLCTVIKACEKYGLFWLAYAVMPTHSHLLLGGDLPNITKARRKISYTYSVYARKKYPELCLGSRQIIGSKNKVKWLQTSYDIKNVIRYIHLNPIRQQQETTLGESIRGSYGAVLALLEPQDTQNPFNRFFELQEIRDALAFSLLCQFFGKSHNAQKQAFLTFHQNATPSADSPVPLPFTDEKLKIADAIVYAHFCKVRYYDGKPFDAKNRQEFLLSLSRRNNPHKVPLIYQLSQKANLSSREIADLLHIGHSTVKDILRKTKK